MIIEKLHIEKFRGFKNSTFTLGEYVTLIAGQNGTQKSTLLGMISQPFTITDKENPLYGEKPLSGDSFRSGFRDKFRLSPTFDLPKEHEWTIYLKGEDDPFTVQSMLRDKQSNQIRFWKKSNRQAGSGYIQIPVIYLSLKRLIPLGEEDEKKTSTSSTVALTADEVVWFSNHYKKIMINQTEQLSSVDYVNSPNKDTLAVTTQDYDWNTNSAGQDNIGKILLAILSFKRLKEKYPQAYKGGLLAIDEIDATLYPGSQVKLLEEFGTFCKDLKIQLVATTHSLQLLEKADKLKKSRTKLYNTVYLKRQDKQILIDDTLEYERIVHNLNVSLGGKPQPKPKPKITVFTEDPECIHFTKALLGNKFKLDFSKVSLGCKNYIHMATRKVPSFIFPNSIIVLDGDAEESLRNKRLKNFITLPGTLNPEGMLATYLHSLADADSFWSSKLPDYTKQVCFRDFPLEVILSDRSQAKRWYNQQLETGAWGQRASHLFKSYLPTILEEKELFIEKFEKIYQDIEKAKAL